MLGKLSAVKWETRFFFITGKPDIVGWTGSCELVPLGCWITFFFKLGPCITWNRINSGLVGHISTLRSGAGLLSTKCCVQLCICDVNKQCYWLYSEYQMLVCGHDAYRPIATSFLFFIFLVFDSTQFVLNCTFQPPKLLMLHKSYISAPLIFVLSLR